VVDVSNDGEIADVRAVHLAGLTLLRF